MNAERLLAHYERIADAPDAISRLRRFILDLAVRGKLVPQDPNDEPASELLKRIAKEELDHADLPQGWRRAKIGSILDFQYGKGLKASDRLDEGPVPVFGSNGIVGFTDEPLTVRPSIIVGRKGSAGALNLCDGPSWTTDVAYFVEAPSFFDLRFLMNALAALDLDKLGKGVKPGLSRSEAYDQIIALPPLNEQRRIVAKVDELMALIDRLEAARAGREAVRDRLAAASLARLNAPDPKTGADPAKVGTGFASRSATNEKFQADARFALDSLPALTTRPDQIKRLRQTILNLAVRGKLVPQDANDEPASELLKRIAKEKARLVKAGEIRKPKPSEPIRDEELPIKLPTNWAWARLCEIGNLSGGMTPSMNRSDFWDGDIVWLSPKDIKSDEVADSDLKISALGLAETRLELYQPGCLFMVARSGILKRTFPVSINRVPAAANQDMKVLAPFLDGQERYLQIMFRGLTDFLLRELVKTGTTVQSLKYAEFEQQPFPLPPLAEQHRIVAKADALMALCDRLEASLDQTAATRRRLLDALLAEALAPVGDFSDDSIETIKQVLHA